jgi:hypothetical protein
MARGWKSKAVEQQQEEVAAERAQRKAQLTAEQIVERQRRTALELSRKRIVQQLDVAVNPRHREMLEAALADLDAQLGSVSEQHR